MPSMINQFLKEQAYRHIKLKQEVEAIEGTFQSVLLKYAMAVYGHKTDSLVEGLEWHTETGQPRLHFKVGQSNRGEWSEEFYDVPLNFFSDPDAYITEVQNEQIKRAEDAQASAKIAKEEKEKEQLALLLAKYPDLKK